MLCTLEASQVLLPNGSTAQHLALANQLRGTEGVRLRNCEINTGKASYAFNAIQVTQLPNSLKPPEGTYGGGPS